MATKKQPTKKAPRKPATVPGARELAAQVIERVLADEAYAAAALDTQLERYPQLDPRDRALATELVYGALRSRAALLTAVRAHAKKLKNDPFVEARLLVASYQLLALTRVPSHAAVNAAVEAVRGRRGPRVGGFINAVLRKVAAEPKRSAQELALASAPDWLVEKLGQVVGREHVAGCLAPAAGETVSVSLRVVAGRALPEWLEALPHGRWSPRARMFQGGDPRRREGYREGAFVVQEEGAQVVGLALGARPGERVLDACAGRGQKTSLLAEQVGASGEVWATDLYPKKVAALERELERLKLPPAKVAAVDWTLGAGDVPEAHFDRVLVDAPCTGTGTLRHRPEIALRSKPEDGARLAELGETILRAAATRVRPGGRVVYAVCSLLAEEGEQLAARVGDILEPVAFDAPELAELTTQGTQLLLTPVKHGTDGYFVASFRKPLTPLRDAPT